MEVGDLELEETVFRVLPWLLHLRFLGAASRRPVCLYKLPSRSILINLASLFAANLKLSLFGLVEAINLEASLA